MSTSDAELLRRYTEPANTDSRVILSIKNIPSSSEEVRARSVVTIDTMSMKPGASGLMSRKLGTVDDTPCETCGQTSSKCEFHWGHIPIPLVVRPEARKKVARLLNAFCTTCSENSAWLPMHYTKKELQRFINIPSQNRLEAITESGIKSCGTSRCATSAEKGYTFKKDVYQILYAGTAQPAIKILNLLNKMSQRDLAMLGIDVFPASRFMMDAIPVPPIQFRPPEKDANSKFKHPLTMALYRILEPIYKSDSKTSDVDKQNAIMTAYIQYINQKDEIKLVNSNHKVIGLRGLMDGKKGVIRGDINGKRPNFGARSVASPDPSLKITEFGVPQYIASNVTNEIPIYNLNLNLYKALLVAQSEANSITYFQTLVAKHNEYLREVQEAYNEIVAQFPNSTRADIKKMFDNRRSVIRKANTSTILQYQLLYKSRGSIKYITKGKTGKLVYINTPEKAASFKLKTGDKVHRTLIDGDLIVINRQPGLHRYSKIGGKAVIKPYRTTGMHPSWCAGTNADFDGVDRMQTSINLHSSQEADKLPSTGSVKNVQLPSTLDTYKCAKHLIMNREVP